MAAGLTGFLAKPVDDILPGLTQKKLLNIINRTYAKQPLHSALRKILQFLESKSYVSCCFAYN
ncbi:MAG: hypothetical protein ACK542_06775, partial [Burkholderiales bacterium]